MANHNVITMGKELKQMTKKHIDKIREQISGNLASAIQDFIALGQSEGETPSQMLSYLLGMFHAKLGRVDPEEYKEMRSRLVRYHLDPEDHNN